MRILHVITRLILGGAQQNTLMSCAAQAADGHEVHLAFGPVDLHDGPEGSLLEAAEQCGATLHVIDPLVREVDPLRDVRAYRALKRCVRGLRPDVVHTHSSKAGIVGRGAAWAARDAGLPKVVHTVHGLPWNDAQPAWKRRLFIASERWAARRCDALIGITAAMAEAFEAEGVAPRDRFVEIPSGVDLNVFSGADDAGADRLRQQLGLPPEVPLVGLVARLDALKGHADLLAAWPAVRVRVPGAHLVFIGDGHDAPVVREAAAGLGGAVTLVGRVALHDMPAAYRMLDLCVLPSHQEGQSRVLVEALACGTPVVAYDVGGMPSICVDGMTGRLVRPGDTAALGGVVAWMLENPARAAALARNGRAHVEQRFSARAMRDGLAELYARLMKQ